MEGINNPMSSPYYGKIEHVHVMLVDNDKEFTKKMTDFLTFYEYKGNISKSIYDKVITLNILIQFNFV